MRKLDRRAFLKKAALAATALGTGVAGHLVARRKYGSSYPKRIPLVRRVYADRRTSFDFYFGRHGKALDSVEIVRVIERAKKEGKPYNVIVIELADLPLAERKNREQEFNRIRQLILANGETGDKAKQTQKELKKAYKNTQIGWLTSLLDTAAKEGLYFKFGEEYTPETIERMNKLRELESEHLDRAMASSDSNKKRQEMKALAERRLAIKALAEYLLIRDSTIAKTAKQIRAEVAKKPEFKGKKIRVLAAFGRAHINASTNFDRITRTEVKIVGRTEASNYKEEAIALSKKGLKAIRRY